MKSKNSLQFNRKKVLGAETYDATKTYTFEFDATVKNLGNGSYWSPRDAHTRVLFVAPGGYYNQVEINDSSSRIRAGDTYKY